MKDEEKSIDQVLNELKTMRTLVELSPDAVFIQSDRKLVFANQAGAELLGADNVEDLIGQQIIDVVSPRRWQNVQELIDDFLEEKRVPRIEKKFIRMDGTAVDVEVAAIPFTYQGKPAMQMVAQDITRRKLAEEALRESEERFRHLIDNAPLGFLLFDPKGQIVTANPCIVKLFGFSSEKLLKLINGLEHPMMVNSGIADSIVKCMEIKQTLFSEHLFTTKTGKEIWLRISLTPLLAAGDKLTGIQALVEDYTERKKAEDALKESEQRFREILENVQLAAIIVDVQGKIQFCNDFLLKLTGWTRAEVLGNNWFEIFIPFHQRAQLAESFEQMIAQKSNLSFYHPEYIQTKDGELRLVALNSMLFFDPDGNVSGLTCLGEDITERKKAEAALRESEERYRDLFENANDLIQSVAADGRVIYVNKAWRRVLGYEEWELGSLNFTEIIHPDCLAHCMDYFQRVFRGESLIGIEATFLTKDGRMIEVEGNVTPRWENEVVVATRGIFRDITERKRAQEELIDKDRRIQKELQLANTIQSSLFPVNLPQIEGATLAATAVPANEVGGDYCDLFITNDKKLGIAIGDVMGKGVPAALFVAMTYAFVRNYAITTDSPSYVVNRVNRSLFPQLEFAEQFITFFYGIYDPQTKVLRYTNAGHNPPLVYRAATGECEYLRVRDFFVGGRQDAQYREGETILETGDVVLFYTDGIKEGQNSSKEQFGMERIKRLLKESAIYDPASIQELISYEFNDFLSGEPPYDDVTMMVIKIDQ